MPKLKMELSLATLIPDFVYQFLSNEYIKQDHLTCLELEDVREALAASDSQELDEIRSFLSAGDDAPPEITGSEFGDDDEPADRLSEMSDVLDEELAEVDNEYYHSYTPGELRFIFEKIIDNIDDVYSLFHDMAGMNMVLTVGFVTAKGLEANMIIEFTDINGKPECPEDVFYLPVGNYMVSDSKAARVYFRVEPEKTDEAGAQLDEIAALLKLRPENS